MFLYHDMLFLFRFSFTKTIVGENSPPIILEPTKGIFTPLSNLTASCKIIETPSVLLHCAYKIVIC